MGELSPSIPLSQINRPSINPKYSKTIQTISISFSSTHQKPYVRCTRSVPHIRLFPALLKIWIMVFSCITNLILIPRRKEKQYKIGQWTTLLGKNVHSSSRCIPAPLMRTKAQENNTLWPWTSTRRWKTSIWDSFWSKEARNKRVWVRAFILKSNRSGARKGWY